MIRQITYDMPETERKRYKIVRTDSCADVPGFPILTADVTTGECSLMVAGEAKSYSLGPHSIRILLR